jgi:hypothetical protein
MFDRTLFKIPVRAHDFGSVSFFAKYSKKSLCKRSINMKTWMTLKRPVQKNNG